MFDDSKIEIQDQIGKKLGVDSTWAENSTAH